VIPRHISSAATTALLLVAPAAASAQARIDSELVAYIAAIKAVDSHAHPMRVVAAGAPADSEYDALPLDGIPPFQVPWRLRLDNDQWRPAQRALFGPLPTDTGVAYRDALARNRTRVMAEQGAHFPSWVLDNAGIDVMLANRIVLGEGVTAPRFRWVPFADPLMLPFDARTVAARTPDTRSLYPKEANLLRRYLRDIGVAHLPATLDAFDGGPEQGWAEVAWLGNTTARRALAEALSGLLVAGDLDRGRAEAVARMVMRENAIEAYHLNAH